MSDEPVIYYVNSSLDSGNNDGSSWDNAFYPFDIFDPLEMAIDEAYGNENIIIYVADYMEPNRDFPGVERLRELAYTDIRGALKLGLEMTLEHLKEQGGEVSPASRQALDYLNR